MASKSKVSVSSEPPKHRLSSAERHAARAAEIANKQSDLKREAAERRAKRSSELPTKSTAPVALDSGKPPDARPSDTP